MWTAKLSLYLGQVMGATRNVVKSRTRLDKWAVILAILGTMMLASSLVVDVNSTEQHFVYLARSFLQAKPYFLTTAPSYLYDLVYYEGRVFLHFGPFPAVLLMPFVFTFELFGAFFYQGVLQFFLTFGVVVLCFKLARGEGFDKTDSWYLSYAFVFATVYHIVAFLSGSWFVTHTVTAFFTFLAIYEWKTRRRYWLIGIFYAFIFATRITAGLGILFFVFDLILNSSYEVRDKTYKLLQILLPIVVCGILLLYYNYVRFHDPFTNGYYLISNLGWTDQDRFELVNYGLFKLKNIPTNFYYYFLKGLDPIPLNYQGAYGKSYILKFPYYEVRYPGISFFVVSPIFLYLVKLKIKDKETILYIGTILLILFFLLMYYWPGWMQTGPRYMVDLLPFAYMLLLKVFDDRCLTRNAKILILASSLINLYLLRVLFYVPGTFH